MASASILPASRDILSAAAAGSSSRRDDAAPSSSEAPAPPSTAAAAVSLVAAATAEGAITIATLEGQGASSSSSVKGSHEGGQGSSSKSDEDSRYWDEHPARRALLSMAAGTWRAVVGMPLEHPLDVVKTARQAHPELNIAQVVRYIVAAKGWQGFYTGAIPNTARAAIKQGYRYTLMLSLPPVFNRALEARERAQWERDHGQQRLGGGRASSLKSTDATSPDSASAVASRARTAKILTGVTIANVEVFVVNPLERLKVFLMTAVDPHTATAAHPNAAAAASSGTASQQHQQYVRDQLRRHPVRYFFASTKGRTLRELYRGTSAQLPRQNVSWVTFLASDHYFKARVREYKRERMALQQEQQNRLDFTSSAAPSSSSLFTPTAPAISAASQAPAAWWDKLPFASWLRHIDHPFFHHQKSGDGSLRVGQYNVAVDYQQQQRQQHQVTTVHQKPLPATTGPAFVELSWSDLMAVGAAVGVVNTMCTLPLDCIKTHMQKANSDGGGFVATTKGIMRRSGVRGFYAGFAPRMAQYMVQSVLTVSLVEKLEATFQKSA